jgi:SAM-dependent methyltransferase
LGDYTDFALERAVDNAESKRREVVLLRRVLRAARVQGPVLDLGAGWGRLAPLYEELGLAAVYAEPATLGLRLMQRSGLRGIVRAQGEELPFARGVFPATIVGWVLHHPPSPTVDPATIVAQAARVIRPGGLLVSVEPVRTSFEAERWTELLQAAGFQIDSLESFFDTWARNGEREHHSLAVSRRVGGV